MKTKISFALVAAVVASHCFAQELTAEQIIEKSIAASGGKEAYAKQKSTVTKADVSLNNGAIKGEAVTYISGQKILVVMSLPGLGDMTQGYDGKTAWSDDQMYGLRKIEGAEKEAFLQMRSISLVDYNKQFVKVALAGVEKVEDKDCYVLEFKPKVGEPIKQYIDKTTFLVSKIFVDYKSAAQAMKVEILLKDYKSIEGVMSPQTSIMNLGAVTLSMKTTSTKVNVPIPDAKFTYPGDKKTNTPAKTTKTTKKTNNKKGK